MIDVDALEQLPDTWRQLVADGVVGSPGEDLARITLTARTMRELADHLEVTALGALDRDGYTDAVHGATTVVWFGREARLPHPAVRGQLKTARLLEKEMVPTARAWFEGRITRDHVRVLLDGANPRIRDQFAAEQEDLIAAVAAKRFDVWQREVAERVRLLDQDGVEPDDPTITTASWARSDAFAQLQARFGGADAETVHQIIETKTDELFRQQTRDRKMFPEIIELTRNELRGRAIVILLLESQAVDVESSTPPRTAVHVVLHASGLHCPTDEDGQVDWPDLSAATDVTWRLTNPDSRRLDTAAFAAMFCGCDVHPLLVDENGNPLKLGLKVRFATTKQRRVVLIRDGGCIFPGCDCPVSWADIHHVIRYEDDGPTDIDNLVALCRRHHGVAHRNGWTLTATGDGWFIWQSPTGARRWSQRHGIQRAGPLPATGPPRTQAA